MYICTDIMYTAINYIRCIHFIINWIISLQLPCHHHNNNIMLRMNFETLKYSDTDR